MNHLITLLNADDALTVCNAVQERYRQYQVRVRKCVYLANEHPEYKVEAEYIGRRRLTIVQANIAYVLIPEFAQAFYAGMQKERESEGTKRLNEESEAIQ
jgi:hypothetical protein